MILRKIIYSLILIFSTSFICSGQSVYVVSGRITDELNKGLPFATIHVKGTSNGTTSNKDGYYTLRLKSETATLVFKFVGYNLKEESVTFDSPKLELNVIMIPAVIQLKEVVISADKEDPAYEIIRNAIKSKSKYIAEVNSFSCDVYIKGLQRLDKAPKKILGVKINIDTGIVYLSESVSKLSFKQPDHFKEIMVSSKVSGRNNAFSYNQASDMDVNFYENRVLIELNDRGYISPLSNNAFLFYKFSYEGTIYENELEINKIKVIPIRKNDPTFDGYIYIIEDSWRIHSADLILTKDHQIEFIDSLRIKQVYTPVNERNWLLLSQSFSFQFKAFGFTGDGYFIGVLSNYLIDPPLEKRFFDNEILFVEENSNKRDSSYWSAKRPIPLTNDEILDYKVKDSLQIIKESKQYLDSVDSENNKPTLGNFFVSGYTNRNTYQKRSVYFPPLFSSIQFNTVEGAVININPSYTKRYENNKFYRISPTFRYGFSSNKFHFNFAAQYSYNPIKSSSIAINSGSAIQQLNSADPISPFVNSIYTLFARRNYMKIYQKRNFKFIYRTEIQNGLRLTGSLEYSKRRFLSNSSDYSFTGEDTRLFTPNDPDNINLNSTQFPDHSAFIMDLNLRIRFAEKYMIRPNRKISLGSKYPTVNLFYSVGIPEIFNASIRYDRIGARISDSKTLGLVGTSDFLIEASSFISKDSISIIDFQHFNGNRTVVGNYDLGNFQLLDYYFYSTSSRFYKFHLEHHFNGFFFNKMPGIRSLKTQAVFSVNYLNTKEAGNYVELGFGIEHILKILRVDFFMSLNENGSNRKGVVFGFGF